MQFKQTIIKVGIWTKARAVEKETWEGITLASSQIISFFNPNFWHLFTSLSISVVAVIRIVTKGATTTASEILNAAADGIAEQTK